MKYIVKNTKLQKFVTVIEKFQMVLKTVHGHASTSA